MKFFLILLALCLLSPSSVFGKDVSKCQDEACVRSAVVGAASIASPDQFCKSLQGKKHEFFDDSLEEICHLIVARKKAGERTKFKCDNQVMTDWTMSMSNFTLPIYNDHLYKQVPQHLKLVQKIKGLGYNNSTIYNTYVFSRSQRTTDSDGTEKSFDFKTYFCITKEKPQHYIPYFYAFNVSKEKEKQHVYRYLEAPPFQNDPIFEQPPHVKIKAKDYVMIDFNKDGFQDFVWIEAKSLKYYVVGLCLYKKGDACEMAESNPPIELKPFSPAFNLKVKPGQEITLEVKDEPETPVVQTFRFGYKKGKLQLKK